MGRMIHTVYDKKPASDFQISSNLPHKEVTKNGKKWVLVSAGPEKYSRCRSYIKAVGLTYATLYSLFFALISKKFRVHLVDSYQSFWQGKRIVERFAKV